MANKWLLHIKKTMKQMKSKGTYIAGKGLGQVIKAAKKTWHSAKKSVGLKGGAEGDDSDAAATNGTQVEPEPEPETPAPAPPPTSGGRRHRKTRRRRHSRRR
jgi:hypothetical protein